MVIAGKKSMCVTRSERQYTKYDKESCRKWMNGNRFICILYKFFVSKDSRFLITQDKNTHTQTHTLYIWLHPQWFFHYIFFRFSSFAVHCVFRAERQLMLDCCCCCYCWWWCSILLLLLLLFISFRVFFLSAVKEEEKKSLPNHRRRQRQRKCIAHIRLRWLYWQQ